MLVLASTAMTRRSKPLVTETMTFLMLPNDLLLNCLARVSRLYYPTLALVSKKLRSLITSLELYETRTLLGCTESCLYVCLRFSGESNPTRWFTLERRPIPNPKPRWYTPFLAPYRFIKNRTRKSEKILTENSLVSIPTRSSQGFTWSIIAIGNHIYMIGGMIGGIITGIPSSRVFSMDCRSHTWREAPSMGVARKFPCVSVVDGKIYVAESCVDLGRDLSNKVECFYPKTQLWEHVPSPDAEICGGHIRRSFSMEGKLYLAIGSKSVVYNLKENRWDEVDFMNMNNMYLHNNFCVVDNILYYYKWPNKLQWYDFEARAWKDLKGLQNLTISPEHYYYVRLVDYGGKIAVLWEEKFVVKKEKNIWCAEISLERHNGQEIHGKLEWCDVVLTVPIVCSFMQSLAVTV